MPKNKGARGPVGFGSKRAAGSANQGTPFPQRAMIVRASLHSTFHAAATLVEHHQREHARHQLKQ
jgi:hypothetical protein